MRLIERAAPFSHAWTRLKHIAYKRYPEALADLALLEAKGVPLSLYLPDDDQTYFVASLDDSSDVVQVYVRRKREAQISLDAPLAAFAARETVGARRPRRHGTDGRTPR